MQNDLNDTPLSSNFLYNLKSYEISINFWKCFCGASNLTPICTALGSVFSLYFSAKHLPKSIPDLPTPNINLSKNIQSSSYCGYCSDIISICLVLKSILVTLHCQ